jgi:hypothetical protein
VAVAAAVAAAATVATAARRRLRRRHPRCVCPCLGGGEGGGGGGAPTIDQKTKKGACRSNQSLRCVVLEMSRSPKPLREIVTSSAGLSDVRAEVKSDMSSASYSCVSVAVSARSLLRTAQCVFDRCLEQPSP